MRGLVVQDLEAGSRVLDGRAIIDGEVFFEVGALGGHGTFHFGEVGGVLHRHHGIQMA